MDMRAGYSSRILLLGLGLILGVGAVGAKPKPAQPTVSLTADGKNLQAQYAAALKSLQAEIGRSLPSVSERDKTALQRASDAVKKAQAEADGSQKDLGKVGGAKASVEHAKGKWIGGAEKGIAAATAALKKASTDAEREAANKDLANWQKNKEDGLKALKERQAAYDKAKADESTLRGANESTKATLAKVQADEASASKVVLTAGQTHLIL